MDFAPTQKGDAMDDLISRQATIDALSMMQGIVAENGVRKGISLAWQQIKDLPSAHPLDPCETCLHKGKGWDEEPCDGCTQNDSKYEPDNGWIPVRRS